MYQMINLSGYLVHYTVYINNVSK